MPTRGHLSSRPARIALLAVILMIPARARPDDATDAFKQGMTAIEKGNWADAERRMRQAAASKPAEGGSVKLYGMRFEEYLPHYYLGLALFQLGRCDEALAAWRTSEEQGAVKKTGLYRTLVKNRGVCQTRVATAVSKPPGAATPAPQPAVAPPTPPPKPDAAAVAAAARRAEAESARAEDPARQSAPPRTLGARPAATPTPVAAASGPPSELLAAAQAYFAGRYREAASQLENRSFPQPKAQTQALLVRAAARFALYAVGGERDRTLLSAAQEDIRGAWRLDPSLSPDARAFSPRFRDLVARSR